SSGDSLPSAPVEAAAFASAARPARLISSKAKEGIRFGSINMAFVFRADCTGCQEKADSIAPFQGWRHLYFARRGRQEQLNAVRYARRAGNRLRPNAVDFVRMSAFTVRQMEGIEERHAKSRRHPIGYLR